jgi:hypothetical protein
MSIVRVNPENSLRKACDMKPRNYRVPLHHLGQKRPASMAKKSRMRERFALEESDARFAEKKSNRGNNRYWRKKQLEIGLLIEVFVIHQERSYIP